MFAMFYFLTLYMQLVKGYSPLRTGVAYLPIAVGIGLAAGWLGPQSLARMSMRTVTAAGLFITVVGMAWFAVLTPGPGYRSGYLPMLLPAMIVAGIGFGLAFITTTIAGVYEVAPQDTGIASGLINATLQIGGAIGLAALATIASTATRGQLSHAAPLSALTHGYTVGFIVSGAIYMAATIVAALTLYERHSSAP